VKTKKKLLLCLTAAVLVVNVATTTAFAMSTPEESNSNQSLALKAEQTKWIYRNYNGVLQKRLWSVTNSTWLTDWMNA
jgi:hypothetical protein